jgi:hypothetical protein
MLLIPKAVIAETSILGSILLFILLTLCFWSFGDTPSYWPIDDTMNNWNTNFIEDVQIMEVNCPEGYESLSYDFKGFSKYYLCQKEGLYTNSKENDPKNSCTAVEIPAAKIDLLPPNYRICFKRMESTNFNSTYRKTLVNGECPEGYKKCGGVKSSKEEAAPFCIESSIVKCPVSYIGIFRIKDDEEKKNHLGTYDSTQTDELYEIGVFRGATPLIEATIDEEIRCLMDNHIPKNPNRPKFEFDISDKRVCEQGSDQRYQLLGKVNELDLFRTNMPNSLDQLENSKAISTDWSFTLQGRNAISYSQSADCIDKIDAVKEFKNQSEKDKNNYDRIRIILWLAFWLVLAMTALSGASLYLRQSLMWNIRAAFTSMLLAAYIFSLVIILFKVSLQARPDVRSVRPPCMPEYTAKLFDDIVAYSGSVGYRGPFVCFLFSLLGLLGFAVLAYLQRMNHARLLEQESEPFRLESAYGDPEMSFDFTAADEKAENKKADGKEKQIYNDADQSRVELNWV